MYIPIKIYIYIHKNDVTANCAY